MTGKCTITNGEEVEVDEFWYNKNSSKPDLPSPLKPITTMLFFHL
tara:strand:- start:452 stop:586 length:135 start_codon:yes stop_codon:yes gene_type:complete